MQQKKHPLVADVVEEVNDHILLKKDREGGVIGVEIISLSKLAKAPLEVPIK